MHTIDIETPEIVAKGALDRWTFCDASELHDLARDKGLPLVASHMQGNPRWYGGVRTAEEALRLTREGDLSAVEKADRLLSEMNYTPQTARRGFVLDVAGAAPVTPVYLSGNPLNMRRKIRIKDEYAPIAIVYDPTCSAAISADKIFQRGITVLALLRALSEIRPVELWVATGLGAQDWFKLRSPWTRNERVKGFWLATRVETAPLDLAHAAHFLTHAAHVRGIGYGLCHAMGSGGSWPHQDFTTVQKNFRAICLASFLHVSDVLAIPSICVVDELVNDPKAWLERTMAELTEQMQEAA